jgi:hypothetical protein
VDVGDLLLRAERDAARARGLAALGRAFPTLAAQDPGELVSAEQAVAERIVQLLPAAVEQATFGRCASCGRPAPPWRERCERCSGRGPKLPTRRSPRPPGRRRR